MKESKSDRINFRVSPEVRRALEKLADKQGVTQTDVVDGLIRRAAKRQKCW